METSPLGILREFEFCPFQKATIGSNPFNRQILDGERHRAISCCTHSAHDAHQAIEIMNEPVQSIMGATESVAAAVAALLDILGSPMVRDQVSGPWCTPTAHELGQASLSRAKTGERRLLGGIVIKSPHIATGVRLERAVKIALKKCRISGSSVRGHLSLAYSYNARFAAVLHRIPA